jgi:hypothetical protein
MRNPYPNSSPKKLTAEQFREQQRKQAQLAAILTKDMPKGTDNTRKRV